MVFVGFIFGWLVGVVFICGLKVMMDRWSRKRIKKVLFFSVLYFVESLFYFLCFCCYENFYLL